MTIQRVTSEHKSCTDDGTDSLEYAQKTLESNTSEDSSLPLTHETSRKYLEKSLLEVKARIQEISQIVAMEPSDEEKVSTPTTSPQVLEIMKNFESISQACEKLLSAHETMKAQQHLLFKSDLEDSNNYEEVIQSPKDGVSKHLVSNDSLVQLNNEATCASPKILMENQELITISTCTSNNKECMNESVVESHNLKGLDEGDSILSALDSTMSSKTSTTEGSQSNDNEEVPCQWNIKPLKYNQQNNELNKETHEYPSNVDGHNTGEYLNAEESLNPRTKSEHEQRSPFLKQPCSVQAYNHATLPLTFEGRKSLDVNHDPRYVAPHSVHRMIGPHANIPHYSPTTIQHQGLEYQVVDTRAYYSGSIKTSDSAKAPLMYGYPCFKDLHHASLVSCPVDLPFDRRSQYPHQKISMSNPVLHDTPHLTDPILAVETQKERENLYYPLQYAQYAMSPQIAQGLPYNALFTSEPYLHEKITVANVSSNCFPAVEVPISIPVNANGVSIREMDLEKENMKISVEPKSGVAPESFLKNADTEFQKLSPSKDVECASFPQNKEQRYFLQSPTTLYGQRVQPRYSAGDVPHIVDGGSFPFLHHEERYAYGCGDEPNHQPWLTMQQVEHNIAQNNAFLPTQMANDTVAEQIYSAQANIQSNPLSGNEYLYSGYSPSNLPVKAPVFPAMANHPSPSFYQTSVKGSGRETVITRRRTGYRSQKRFNAEKSRNWSLGFDYIKRTFALC